MAMTASGKDRHHVHQRHEAREDVWTKVRNRWDIGPYAA